MLATELSAYEQMRPGLVKHHLGKHVVIRGADLIGAFDTFDSAAREAIKLFGNGPYLIREVREQEPHIPMPASIAYRPIYANS